MERLKYVDVGFAYLTDEEKQVLKLINDNLRILNERIDRGLFTIKICIEAGNKYYLMRDGNLLLVCSNGRECYFAVSAILQSMQMLIREDI